MIHLFRAMGRSLMDLFHPRMLLLLFIPPVLALLLWGGIGYLFWDRILAVSQGYGERFLFSQQIPPWMIEWFAVTPTSVATALAVIIAILLLIPLAVLTSMLLTSLVAMPSVLSYVGKSFPNLEKKGRNILVASAGNLIRSSLIYLILWLISLPFWMIPGFGVALPLFLNGYLNYRLFAYDALGDYASPRELKVLMKRRRVDFLLLGVMTSALVLLPPLFLILPIYSALCFARYSMLELQDYRSKA